MKRKFSVNVFINIFPVILLSLVFNVPSFISLSAFGLQLQKVPQYLKFLLFFQAFHPLTTTGIAPMFILAFLNYKVS